MDLADLDVVAPLILGAPLGDQPKLMAHKHPDYIAWSGQGGEMSRDALTAKLDDRPKGLMRFKGFVAGPDGNGFEVHCVGPTHSIKRMPGVTKTQVVGIGPKARLDIKTLDEWWRA